MVDGVVAVGTGIGRRVALFPDTVVGADTEMFDVTLDLAVVAFDEVAPGFPLGFSTSVL